MFLSKLFKINIVMKTKARFLLENFIPSLKVRIRLIRIETKNSQSGIILLKKKELNPKIKDYTGI